MLHSRIHRVGQFTITISRLVEGTPKDARLGKPEERKEANTFPLKQMTNPRQAPGRTPEQIPRLIPERVSEQVPEQFLEQFDDVCQPYFVVSCPHCQEPILLYKHEIACKIFRHAAYLGNTNNLIGPHTTEVECKRLLAEKLVTGCAGPFQVEFSPGGYLAVKKCDYI